eukprot:CAMPEP_0197033698 /NCGR_PEP_ID=MMETSP1384-20130603/12038_1 /TAXON_ID=29189 /ORGANISM="Ammonia sp." /LENGTH=360 /DNA_ID=CAMNT_0042463541 /DNA_START=52 /DNA_END=1134 /DNA_ORIENTATION=-
MGNSSSDEGERYRFELERERLRAQHAAREAQLQAQMREKELNHQLVLQKQDADHQLAMEQVKRKQIQELQTRLSWLQEQMNTEREEYRKIDEQLQTIQSQISVEMKEIEAFQPERDDPNTKIVVLIGMTGAGKSTFCNRLWGDSSDEADEGPFETSYGSTSCTQAHSKRIIEICGTRITVVDTPGYNDSTGRDEQHCNKLCKYLKGCPGINAFVLIRNASQIRFDMAFQLMLKQYYSMFGEIFFQKLIIMATKIDGTRALQRFEKNKQGKVLQNDICSLFNLELDVPVIPIGLDEYAESVSQFVQSIPDEKFKCKQITSPIEKLKEKEKYIRIEEQEEKDQIEKIQSQIQVTNEKLQQLL